MAEIPYTLWYPSELPQLPDGSALYGYRHAGTRQLVLVGGPAQRIQQPRAQQLGWLEPTAAAGADAEAGASSAVAAIDRCIRSDSQREEVSGGGSPQCAAGNPAVALAAQVPLQETAQETPGLVVRREGEKLRFVLDGQPCRSRAYSREQDLFSRHTGLLESNRLQQAGVIVCGCGSVGGLAALELARCGVGRFLLIDPDLLAIENLCRHPCGLADVGRRKVEAIAERIHQINPWAEVQVQPTTIERLDPGVIQRFVQAGVVPAEPESGREPDQPAAADAERAANAERAGDADAAAADEGGATPAGGATAAGGAAPAAADGAAPAAAGGAGGGAAACDAAGTAAGTTLMLACADSRRADRHAARLAAALQLPFLAIGLWERASAGEIFYSHPGAPMPCYGCAFEELAESWSGKAQPQRRFYSTEEDLEQLEFQPGIGIDIAHVTQIGLKLALDLLNLNSTDYVPRLLGHLSQFTLICNSNDPRLGGERAEIFSHPLQVTTSIQVGYGKSCPPCQWSG